MNYSEAREHLIAQLEQKVVAHELDQYADLDAGFDEFDAVLPRSEQPDFRKLYIALMFWDAWIDAANHEWQYYPGISQKDWPRLARQIVSDLQNDREISEPLLLDQFAARTGERGQSIREFLKRLLGR